MWVRAGFSARWANFHLVWSVFVSGQKHLFLWPGSSAWGDGGAQTEGESTKLFQGAGREPTLCSGHRAQAAQGTSGTPFNHHLNNLNLWNTENCLSTSDFCQLYPGYFKGEKKLLQLKNSWIPRLIGDKAWTQQVTRLDCESSPAYVRVLPKEPSALSIVISLATSLQFFYLQVGGGNDTVEMLVWQEEAVPWSSNLHVTKSNSLLWNLN